MYYIEWAFRQKFGDVADILQYARLEIDSEPAPSEELWTSLNTGVRWRHRSAECLIYDSAT